MKLLLGTNNEGKVIEICEVLSDLPWDIVTPKILGITEDPPETGETFEENALQKAKFFFGHAKLPTLSDDSGIIVEALEDELGLHTRRWGAGPAASDKEWIDHFLKRMKEEENKRARFVCSLVFVDGQGKHHCFEGVSEGTITDTLEADYLSGLPISACFRPDGHSSVFSALSVQEKNAVSHRGRATEKFREFLERNV
jgi:XTP/dITP diphosphohydrolase